MNLINSIHWDVDISMYIMLVFFNLVSHHKQFEQMKLCICIYGITLKDLCGKKYCKDHFITKLDNQLHLSQNDKKFLGNLR